MTKGQILTALLIVISAISLTRCETEEKTTPEIGYSKIAAGVYHSLAIKKDSTIWTWGSNEYGQLGDGSFTDNKDHQKLMEQVLFPFLVDTFTPWR